MRLEKTEGVYGPTLQGEGLNIGMMVTFVRFYGCEFRCTWCDTPFSLGPDAGGEWEGVGVGDIYNRVSALKCRNVVLSGGNPLIQPKQELYNLVCTLRDAGYWIQVETQGSIAPSPELFAKVNFWSLSPKLPSAGEHEHQNWKGVDFFINEVFQQVTTRDSRIDGIGFLPQMQFKFVIKDLTDYEYLKARLKDYGETFMVPVILQPEGLQLETEFSYQVYANQLKTLHELVAGDWDFWKYYTVRVLPQYHKIIWQKERRV